MVRQSVEKTNRLINENSPYLLQHAHNPVDWFAWKKEAFEKAKNENKPIFLSIGYSACHWCHVMEKESFSDNRIAKILNEHFISIKVDREERQDIDDVYMNAVQAITGSGGWPLSVFLTPKGEPFYGGTYFPPTDMPGQPSFERVLLTIADMWKENSDKVIDSADKISQSLASFSQQAQPQALSDEILNYTNTQLKKIFDKVNGGFGTAPKFPQPGCLSLLLNHWYKTGDSESLEMVEQSLAAMAKGGIYDQLGGGFHRYSTDAQWLVPHFEKMLYDQALLSKIYVQAYQAAGRDFYAEIAKDIFGYVLRDMTDPAGGFYSAEDADTQDKEGFFYIWQMEEIENILGKQNAEIFNKYYGVTNKGNFEERKNILHINRTIEQIAEIFNESPQTIKNILAQSRIKLLENRSKRPAPGKDNKIITAWNGLMISSLALGASVLDEQKYVQAAEKSADFLLSTLIQNDRLMRYSRDGKIVNRAFLDDYAFLAMGLIDLYQADFDAKWLIEAKKLTNQMIELFENPDGSFYLTGKDDEHLFIRSSPSFDTSIPSGNSIAAMVLLKLGRTTVEQNFIERAKQLLNAYSAQMANAPVLMAYMLSAFDYYVGRAHEIVIESDNPNRDETKKMLQTIRHTFLPNAALKFRKVEESGKTSAYICGNNVCGRPVTTVKELESELKKLH